MTSDLVIDLLIILAAGLVSALVCRWLRVSGLVGYLLSGVLLGEAFLGWVRDEGHALEYLAEAGVFMLLFSIGLELSLDQLWRLRRDLLLGGGLQMLLVGGPVAGLLLVWGRDWRAAVMLGAAAAFSSTVLVFKTLSEWGHTGLPHGRRAIAILLFQDAALVPLLLLVPLLTGQGEAAGALDYLRLAGVSLLFVAGVVLLRHVLGWWLIPWLARYRSPELVVLFTLVSLGGVTWVAYQLGLPPAIGAFAAGLIFSGNRWTHQVDALILPFRETFAAVFFVSLGLLLDAGLVKTELLLLLGWLSGLVLLKWLAAGTALRVSGLGWRPSIGMGLGLAHVGEFAFVLVLMGTEAGLLSRDDYQRIVTLAIGSLILTPLLLPFGLRWTDRREPGEAGEPPLDRTAVGRQAVVVGAGPIGRQVTSRLETMGVDVCLVDLSPMNLHPFAQQGFRTVVGDARDRQTLELAGISEASIVVICVPNDKVALNAVRSARTINANCLVLVRCRYESNVRPLQKAGADRVVSEEVRASEALLGLLEREENP